MKSQAGRDSVGGSRRLRQAGPSNLSPLPLALIIGMLHRRLNADNSLPSLWLRPAADPAYGLGMICRDPREGGIDAARENHSGPLIPSERFAVLQRPFPWRRGKSPVVRTIAVRSRVQSDTRCNEGLRQGSLAAGVPELIVGMMQPIQKTQRGLGRSFCLHSSESHPKPPVTDGRRASFALRAADRQRWLLPVR